MSCTSKDIGPCSKTTTLNQGKVNKTFYILEWLSHISDLNLTEMLWKDLKQIVHEGKPSNIFELKLFSKEEK